MLDYHKYYQLMDVYPQINHKESLTSSKTLLKL